MRTKYEKAGAYKQHLGVFVCCICGVLTWGCGLGCWGGAHNCEVG